MGDRGKGHEWYESYKGIDQKAEGKEGHFLKHEYKCNASNVNFKESLICGIR